MEDHEVADADVAVEVDPEADPGDALMLYQSIPENQSTGALTRQIQLSRWDPEAWLRIYRSYEPEIESPRLTTTSSSWDPDGKILRDLLRDMYHQQTKPTTKKETSGPYLKSTSQNHLTFQWDRTKSSKRNTCSMLWMLTGMVLGLILSLLYMRSTSSPSYTRCHLANLQQLHKNQQCQHRLTWMQGDKLRSQLSSVTCELAPLSTLESRCPSLTSTETSKNNLRLQGHHATYVSARSEKGQTSPTQMKTSSTAEYALRQLTRDLQLGTITEICPTSPIITFKHFSRTFLSDSLALYSYNNNTIYIILVNCQIYDIFLNPEAGFMAVGCTESEFLKVLPHPMSHSEYFMCKTRNSDFLIFGLYILGIIVAVAASIKFFLMAASGAFFILSLSKAVLIGLLFVTGMGGIVFYTKLMNSINPRF